MVDKVHAYFTSTIQAAQTADVGGSSVQSFSFPDLGTPKGCMVVVTSATSTNTTTDHMRLSVGLSDGTNYYGLSAQNEHGQANVDTDRAAFNDAVIRIPSQGGGSFDGVATVDAFSEDSVDLNWSSYPGSAYQITVIAWFGDDITLAVGEVVPNANGGTPLSNPKTVSTSAEPHHIIHLSHGLTTSADETLVDDCTISIGQTGYDTSTVRERSINFDEQSGATSSQPSLILDTDAAQPFRGGSTTSAFVLGASTEITAVNATDFQVASGDRNGTGPRLGYMWINYGSANLSNRTQQTPPTSQTAPYDYELTSYGFVGQCALGFTTIATTGWTSDKQRAGTDAGCIGISAFTLDHEVCISWQSEDNQTTTDTSSRVHTSALYMPNHSASSIVYEATLDSWGANGPVLNYTTFSTSSRSRMAIFVLEQQTSDATGSVEISGAEISGSGSVLVAGSGDAEIAGPEIDGAGSVPVGGTGDVELNGPEISGSGSIVVAGSGSLEVGNPEITGLGEVLVTGTGAVEVGGPEISGSGGVAISGSGSLEISGPEIVGAGGVAISGTGTPEISGPEIIGSGAVLVSGTGDVELTGPEIVGTGSVTSAPGEGNLELTGPEISGVGGVLVTGTGAVEIAGPEIASSGSVLISGSGDLEIGGPELEGAGSTSLGGTGQVEIGGPEIVGSGGVQVSGSGNVELAGPEISGSGAMAVQGSGSIELGGPIITGVAREFGCFELTYAHLSSRVAIEVEAALGIPVDYPNMEFDEPSGNYVRFRHQFFDHDLLAVGKTDTRRYRIRGDVELSVMTPSLSGWDAGAKFVDDIITAFRGVAFNGIRIRRAVFGATTREADHYRIDLRFPFESDKDEFILVGASGSVTTYDGTHDAIATRFKTLVADVNGTDTAYPNMEFAVPADSPWYRLRILFAESPAVSTGGTNSVRYRTTGIVVASCFEPILSGTNQGLGLADDVVDAFRGVSDTGITFETARVVTLDGPRSGKFHQTNVEIPFYVDAIA